MGIKTSPLTLCALEIHLENTPCGCVDQVKEFELKHVATRREVFAIGAHRWAEWLNGQPTGLTRA